MWVAATVLPLSWQLIRWGAEALWVPWQAAWAAGVAVFPLLDLEVSVLVSVSAGPVAVAVVAVVEQQPRQRQQHEAVPAASCRVCGARYPLGR